MIKAVVYSLHSSIPSSKLRYSKLIFLNEVVVCHPDLALEFSLYTFQIFV